MLHGMTPEQFEERLAHYKIDPWGDDWAGVATIAREVQEQTQTYVAFKTQKQTPESKLPKLFDFIPMPRWLRDRYTREFNRNRIAKSNGSHRNHRR